MTSRLKQEFYMKFQTMRTKEIVHLHSIFVDRHSQTIVSMTSYIFYSQGRFTYEGNINTNTAASAVQKEGKLTALSTAFSITLAFCRYSSFSSSNSHLQTLKQKDGLIIKSYRIWNEINKRNKKTMVPLICSWGNKY